MELLFDLCDHTPISEREYEFYEMFQPFWTLINSFLHHKELLHIFYE